MHLFGKILVWLTIPVAIAAIIFTARMVEVRNTWTEKVEKLEKDNQNEAKQIADLKRELNKVQQQYNLVSLPWNQYFDDIGVGALPADNTTVIAQLGKVDLALPDGAELPVLQGFEIAADDSTKYVGPFAATEMQANSSQLKSTWKLRPGDAERWNTPGVKWRWRLVIPSPNTDRFIDIQNRLVRADQVLEDRNKNLEIQDSLYAAAQERLKGHLQELGVDPEQADLKGLVDAVAAEEESRNADWRELDRLRRALSAEMKRRSVLSGENRGLMQKLPKPATSEPPKKTGVAVKDSLNN